MDQLVISVLKITIKEENDLELDLVFLLDFIGLEIQKKILLQSFVKNMVFV